MSHEHEAPRYTPEQRDEILNLAARLQVQHEVTVGTDELVSAAEEAGIDARFVHEAAMRLSQKSRPKSKIPAVALGLFAFQASYFVFIQNIFMGGFRGTSAFEAQCATVLAFVLAVWAGRERRVRRYVPGAALATWAVIWLGLMALTPIIGNGQPYGWIGSFVAIFGLLQTAAAFVGSLLAAAIDRQPLPATETPKSLEF